MTDVIVLVAGRMGVEPVGFGGFLYCRILLVIFLYKEIFLMQGSESFLLKTYICLIF